MYFKQFELLLKYDRRKPMKYVFFDFPKIGIVQFLHIWQIRSNSTSYPLTDSYSQRKVSCDQMTRLRQILRIWQ